MHHKSLILKQQRLQLISLGEPGLAADLRELNARRPPTNLTFFFSEKLGEVVETMTAVDERRYLLMR